MGLPGLAKEPAKAMVIKTLVTKESAQHLSTKDPVEEDSHIIQGLLDFKQTQNNFKTAQLIMSSPPAVVGGTGSCSGEPL